MFSSIFNTWLKYVVLLIYLKKQQQVKCCKYWPDDSEMYGDIKITLLKTETLAEYTVRTFALERVGLHFHLKISFKINMNLKPLLGNGGA